MSGVSTVVAGFSTSLNTSRYATVRIQTWIGAVTAIPIPHAMAPILPIILATTERPKKGQKLVLTMLKLSFEAGQNYIRLSTMGKRPNIRKA